MAEEKVSELLACPLCAERMLLEQFVDWEERPLPVQHIIHSKPSTCPLASFMLAATDEAIELWNRRTPTPVTEDVGEWVMVPREPTQEILRAAMDDLGWWVEPYTAPRESGVPIESDMSAEDAALINAQQIEVVASTYRAMLSASPSPPKADGPGEVSDE